MVSQRKSSALVAIFMLALTAPLTSQVRADGFDQGLGTAAMIGFLALAGGVDIDSAIQCNQSNQKDAKPVSLNTIKTQLFAKAAQNPGCFRRGAEGCKKAVNALVDTTYASFGVVNVSTLKTSQSIVLQIAQSQRASKHVLSEREIDEIAARANVYHLPPQVVRSAVEDFADLIEG